MTSNSSDFFTVTVSPETLQREKEKARALRRSQWWQRKLAKGECAYCKGRFAPDQLTMDHIVPVIRGGRSSRGNLAPACKACNNRKKYLLPVEWEDYLRGLTGARSSAGKVNAGEEEATHEAMPGV